eukprot:COSAG02_NODE_6267_length_3694_cov_3.159110_3_plen_147_part_00
MAIAHTLRYCLIHCGVAPQRLRDGSTGSWCTGAALGWQLRAAMGSSTPKEGASGGSCMWGFVGAASFATVRGLWGLVMGSDEDARFAVDMQRRMEIRSAEDAFSNQSGVARRCWSACIEPAAGPSQAAGVMPVRSCSNLPPRAHSR